jgi:phosphoglycolate phosphatase-like HAD superfamily hydrolase
MDDLPAVWRATCKVFEKANVPALSLEAFRDEFELPFTGFYDRYVPHVPIEQLERWFHEAFSAEQHTVRPMTHSKSFLSFCRERDIRSFVLSAIHPQHFEVHTELSGFGDYFEQSYTGVWDKRKKIHEIIKEHELKPEETLYIGDMEHDIETAHHGGVAACAVLTGFKGLKALQASRPELIVEHLGELKSLMEKTRMNPLESARSANSLSDSPYPIPTVGALIYNQAGKVLMIHPKVVGQMGHSRRKNSYRRIFRRCTPSRDHGRNRLNRRFHRIHHGPGRHLTEGVLQRRPLPADELHLPMPERTTGSHAQ